MKLSNLLNTDHTYYTFVGLSSDFNISTVEIVKTLQARFGDYFTLLECQGSWEGVKESSIIICSYSPIKEKLLYKTCLETGQKAILTAKGSDIVDVLDSNANCYTIFQGVKFSLTQPRYIKIGKAGQRLLKSIKAA